uniref:Filamin C, gamma b (Actin binding protein 280) n=1 Tax=Iconisemion striatum TaxID=60296 RepID=A0A1A7YJ75_9TELE
MPMWEDEDDEDVKKLTPKQRLLGWIQNKVPQLPITNFHRDWRDGKALGALLKPGAPLRAKTLHPKRAKAHGPGIEPRGNMVLKPAEFLVETVEAGMGEVLVYVEDPEGHTEEARVIPNNDKNRTYSVVYLPKVEGLHKVRAWGPGLETGMVGKSADFVVEAIGTEVGTLGFSIEGPSQAKIECDDKGDGSCDVQYWPTEPGDYAVHVICDDEDIKDSPFMAHILPAANDVFPEKVRCYGLGLEPLGCIINKPADFTIDTNGAGRGELKIYAQDSDGFPIDIQITDNGDCTYFCVYIPTKPIKHTIIITWGEVNIPNSPFRVMIGEGSHPENVKVYGPGVEKMGLKANEPTYFTVDCSEAGQGDVSIGIKCAPGVVGPAEADIDFDIIKNDNDTFTVKYMPPGGLVGKPAPFAIDTKGAGTGGLGLTVEGPCEAKIECQDNGDGSCSVSYLPTDPGEYTINILFADQHIPGSPFKAVVQPVFDPSKVLASGPGLEQGTVSETGLFTVDCSKAGEAELTIEIISDSGAKAEVHVQNNGDGTYSITYIPQCHGMYTITIKYGGLLVPKFPAHLQGPSEAKMLCKDNKDGSCSVEYIPFTPGEYDVNITFGCLPISGSPFRVPVRELVDPSKVRCSGPGLGSGVRANVSQTFSVDSSKAGVAPLEVLLYGPTGIAEPVSVTDHSDGTHTVNYTPASDGPYSTHIVKKTIPFSILKRGCDPEGKLKKANILDNRDGTYTVSYVPDITGRYTITIKYGGDEIPYSPYRIHATPSGDASKCLVTVSIGGHGLGSGLGPTIQIGEETVITVDAKAAGKGKVTCKVSTPDGAELDVDVVENADGTFDIYYTAPDPGKYIITIRFGGEHIPNSPFHVVATDDAISPADRMEATLRPFSLVIPFTVQKGDVTGEVRMPSGQTAHPHIADNKDGTVTVKYSPTERGLHEMDIRYEGNHIPGSPLQFYVDTINSGHVTAFGPGLSHGLVNRPAIFTITTKDAGEGGLSLAVEGPSKAEISCKDNKDGTCTVSYLPTAPGDYNIIVKFDEQNIAGSPFMAKITGDDLKRMSQLNVGTATDVSLMIVETDLSSLMATIRAPSGLEEPCFLKQLPNRHIGISFTPKEVGEHVVSVRKSGKHVTNSPFKIMVGQSEIGDANRVKVYGQGLLEGHTLDVAEFVVDTRNAGYGGLGLSIEGPSKVDINCEDVDDGTCKVTYCPTEPGNYIINIKFADQHVPGSPFSAKIFGEGRMKESITRKRQAPSIATVGSTCDLNLKIPGNWFQMVSAQERLTQTFTRSSHTYTRTERTEISKTRGGETKKEVRVEESTQVGGDPFRDVFGNFLGRESLSGFSGMQTGSRPPLQDGEAGNQEMTAQVTSPGGKMEDAEIIKGEDSTYSVRFIPKEMGPHTVNVKYKGQHVPGSPFQFTVGPLGEGGAHKVRAGGTGLDRGVAGIPAEFSIWTREAGAGGLSIAVEGPSKAEITFEDRKDGSCGVSYVVQEPGDYEVSIKFNDEHIPDSPFIIPIASLSDDVRCLTITSLQETGLKVGQEASFAVQLNGVRGLIDAKIHTPSGATEECIITELDSDQNAITFIPKENGVHSIDVRYNGSHIPGSPFRIRVGEPGQVGDPGLVSAFGPGLEGGATGVSSEFIVNTCNAGAGALSVTIDGPSKVKMDCQECPEGYKVSYTPMAPGNYLISIKYGGPLHIVGSPFKAKVSGPRLSGGHNLHETSSVLVETVTKPSEMGGAFASLPKFSSDASKVISRGAGLSKAFIGQKNTFTVDCSKAGTNMLMVGVHGPKTPCEEVYVKHMGNRMYNVTYTVKEQGSYILIVKWGEENIPGSPFHVTVP